MTLNIELPSDAERRFRQLATAAGKDLATFVREAIEEKLAISERGGSSPSARLSSPRLANPAQAADFAKQMTEAPRDAKL
jgi:hypothetical protein